VEEKELAFFREENIVEWRESAPLVDKWINVESGHHMDLGPLIGAVNNLSA
jgi:hypothetical protein